MTEERDDAPEGLTVLRSFENRIDAELLHGLLVENEVESMIRADDAGGLYPSLAAVRGVHVLIRACDRERAERVIDEAIPR